MFKKPSPPLMAAAHLRSFLCRRHFSSPPQHHHHIFRPTHLKPYSVFFPKFFSSQIDPNPLQDTQHIVQSLSHEITKDPNDQTTPLSQRLDISFSHISISNDIIHNTLNLSPTSGRSVFDFMNWVSKRSDFDLTDQSLSYFVDYFGRRKDFKAAHELLLSNKGVSGLKCFESSVDRLVRAGRATQVVTFFEKMEIDYGFVRNLDSLKFVVSKLCDYGYASYAEKLVVDVANEFFPDEFICDTLIKGWCVGGKLDEAKRLVQEMYRGGFEIGVVGYNAILDCVCKLCRKKDPFRLINEAEKVLVEMDVAGVPRNVETFNVLIGNLCKIRKTEDAMNLFDRMQEWGCHPNEETFLTLIKSLYQAARVGEGDEMIDRMKSAGFGDSLDVKAYYEFLTILCGIERVDHALSVFAKMKKDCQPGVKTYDLLMGKLCAHGRVEKANVLFKEAEKKGLLVEVKAYKLDPRFMKKPVVVKEKKRETLPEKMARKRTRLKKIRLSFVKKPKKAQRRAY
uniref:pentatricopeptide repeat-containing protein PNM1, mitochondrial n=1 Tax=Erigeron canadensis TaxID=72917 RepID=UPI001CB8F163|nr:pentatricopeptide repeat-containing protein PNM1, mitochondrial [Erigeron canadensis]